MAQALGSVPQRSCLLEIWSSDRFSRHMGEEVGVQLSRNSGSALRYYNGNLQGVKQHLEHHQLQRRWADKQRPTAASQIAVPRRGPNLFGPVL